jgi:hypothetical protein
MAHDSILDCSIGESQFIYNRQYIMQNASLFCLYMYVSLMQWKIKFSLNLILFTLSKNERFRPMI